MTRQIGRNVVVAEIKGLLKESNYSADALEYAYGRLSGTQERASDVNKLHAEVAYLLANELRGRDNGRASELAKESIGLYRRVDVKTMEDSLPILAEALPSYMHEGVVYARLGDLLRE